MLNISVMDVVYTIINILILFAVFRIFLFKRVDRILEERKNDIDTAKDDAIKMQNEAEAVKAEYNSRIEDIESEKEAAVSAVRQDAYKEYDRIVADARKQADNILIEARKTAEIESQREKDAYVTELTDMVLDAVSRISASKHTKEEDMELYDKFISKASEKQ
jgi:F-type H+-transporting ATPase subunit b